VGAIRVDKRLAAPIDGVFELISDHAAYDRFIGVTSSALVREGEVEPNGLGAVRSIGVGPIRFTEEITAFERPRRMDYLIREVNLPIEHDGGRIMLEPDGAGTRVLWISTFGVPVRWLGDPIGLALAGTLRLGFISLLEQIEVRLRRRA
jgi:uncharacterized protein YndB with AHSA1/START domain